MTRRPPRSTLFPYPPLSRSARAKKVLLVLPPGWGADIAARLLFQLSLVRTPHQLLLSSGGNEELAAQLRRFAGVYGVKAKLFGLVDNLHEFLGVSDLLVAQGGGLTAAEALATGRPLGILHPGPGHEERQSPLPLAAS